MNYECMKVFKEGSEEYKLLEKLALILTFKSPNRKKYVVGTTYFDLGQDWKWTTVLCKDDCWSYQALNPAEQEEIITCDGSLESVAKIADGVLADKFCPDKVVSA